MFLHAVYEPRTWPGVAQIDHNTADNLLAIVNVTTTAIIYFKALFISQNLKGLSRMHNDLPVGIRCRYNIQIFQIWLWITEKHFFNLLCNNNKQWRDLRKRRWSSIFGSERWLMTTGSLSELKINYVTKRGLHYNVSPAISNTCSMINLIIQYSLNNWVIKVFIVKISLLIKT